MRWPGFSGEGDVARLERARVGGAHCEGQRNKGREKGRQKGEGRGREGQTDEQADRQTDRQTGRKNEKKKRLHERDQREGWSGT